RRGEQLAVAHPLGGAAARQVDGADPDRDRAGERAPADLVHAHEHGIPLALQGALHAQARAPGPRTGGRPAGGRADGRRHGAPSGTEAKASGTENQVIRSSGKRRTNAWPTTLSRGTDPVAPVPSSLARESRELDRWSPITQIESSGTVTSNSTPLGSSPG